MCRRSVKDRVLRIFRSVAQLVEHRSPKPGVGGSSPSTPAKFFDLFILTSKEN